MKTKIDTIREALEASKLLMLINANSNEFYERRAQVRPFVNQALAAIKDLEAHPQTEDLEARYGVTHAVGISPPWGIEHTTLRFNSRAEAASVCNELNRARSLSPSKGVEAQVEEITEVVRVWVSQNEDSFRDMVGLMKWARLNDSRDNSISGADLKIRLKALLTR